jgi:hypothetical protein
MIWPPDILPPVVARLTQKHGAIVVGSQAARYASELLPDETRDWDLFVPLANWHAAAKCIPMDSKPNGRRGWRFVKDGTTFDVWPDDLARYFDEATSPHRERAKAGPAFAVDLRAQIAFRADRKAP